MFYIWMTNVWGLMNKKYFRINKRDRRKKCKLQNKKVGKRTKNQEKERDEEGRNKLEREWERWERVEIDEKVKDRENERNSERKGKGEKIREK